MAEAILSRYPDYAKTPREYAAAVTEALAIYPRHIRHRIADIAEGITSLCKFPPSTAEIIEMGNRMVDVERHSTAKAKQYAHIRQEHEFVGNYDPFPKLTAAFAAEPHLAKPTTGAFMSFDILFEASRALAVYGIDAARAVLNARARPPMGDGLNTSRFATGKPFPEHLMRRDPDHDT